MLGKRSVSFVGALREELGGRAPLLGTLQARSYRYPETGSETDFGAFNYYDQDTIRSCHRPPYRTQHPEKTFRLMGLTDSPLYRRCGAKEETSAHVLCKCEALVTLS